MPPGFRQSVIAKRPTRSLPPMPGENINRRNLGDRLWVGIYVPRRNKVAKSHDNAIVLRHKNRTSCLRESLTPELRTALYIQRI